MCQTPQITLNVDFFFLLVAFYDVIESTCPLYGCLWQGGSICKLKSPAHLLFIFICGGLANQKHLKGKVGLTRE